MTASERIREARTERELAQREDKAHIVTLVWSLDQHGQNRTSLIVVDPDGIIYVREVDPKLAFYAYTHAGAYVPEAWCQ